MSHIVLQKKLCVSHRQLASFVGNPLSCFNNIVDTVFFLVTVGEETSTGYVKVPSTFLFVWVVEDFIAEQNT